MASLRKGIITATNIKKFFEDDPNEFCFRFLNVGNIPDENVNELMGKLFSHIVAGSSISCFSTSSDFSNQQKWHDYGPHCFVMEYDAKSVCDAIASFCKGEGLDPTIRKVNYGIPPDLGPWLNESKTIQDHFLLEKRPEGEFVEYWLKHLSKESVDLLLTPLFTKTNGSPFEGSPHPKDYRFEQEVRVVIRPGSKQRDIPEFPVIATNIWPKKLYIRKKEIGPYYLELVNVASELGIETTLLAD